MEGVTLGMNYGLRRLAALGVKAREIRVTGGGARSPVWRQIMADVFGVPVVAMAEDEGAALGAALQAAWAWHGARRGENVDGRRSPATWWPWMRLPAANRTARAPRDIANCRISRTAWVRRCGRFFPCSGGWRSNGQTVRKTGGATFAGALRLARQPPGGRPRPLYPRSEFPL